MTIRTRLLKLAVAIAGVAGVLAGAAAQTPATHHHSFGGAEQWAHVFDDPNRDAWQKPHEVIQALALKPKPQVIWMQLTVRDDEAARRAEEAGIKVVMDRCPKIEYGRLSSEISWMGVNSRTLSSKRAQALGTGVQRMGLGPRRDGGKGA